MVRVTAPTKPIPTELLELDAQLDDAIPCEYTQVIGGPGSEKPCPIEATWVIRWRDVCGHGTPMPTPSCSMVCHEHAATISRNVREYLCGACRCPQTDIGHIVANIFPMPQ